MNQSSKDYFKNEDDRNDFFISIPVIAIAGAFVLWQWGSSADIEPIDTITLSPIETTSEVPDSNTSISYATPLSDILEEERIARQNQVRARTTLPLKPKTKEVAQELPISTIENTDHNLTENDQIVGTADDSAPEVLEDKNSAANSITADNSAPSNTIEEVEETANNAVVDENSLDCSIAVGLYKEDANLHKMHNRLIDKGYNAIIVPLRNSSKVAIRIPCNKESSLRILQEIRSDFADDAFIE